MLRNRFFLSFGLFVTTLSSFPFSTYASDDALAKENQLIMRRSLAIAKLYQLPPGQWMKDITEEVCRSTITTNTERLNLIEYDRRIILFEYPSDGLKVKGIFSYTPRSDGQPVLIFLRGGNRLFGLMNPAADLLSYKDYTIITTTYRDGVSPGKDEFGGTDVNDVKNLIDFIPILVKELKIPLQFKHIFMIGGSRGGLEMFLTLARYPELQNQIDKVVSLSAVLDVHQWIKERPDMKQAFERDFGLIPSVNEEEWLKKRDPLLAAARIQTCLPILILQGTQDTRVSLEEGRQMAKRLRENGSPVTYWEIKGGKHTLDNVPDRLDLIFGWLEFGINNHSPQ